MIQTLFNKIRINYMKSVYDDVTTTYGGIDPNTNAPILTKEFIKTPHKMEDRGINSSDISDSMADLSYAVAQSTDEALTGILESMSGTLKALTDLTVAVSAIPGMAAGTAIITSELTIVKTALEAIKNTP